MGTSTDRTSGSGGSWTPLKRASSRYVRGLNSGTPGSGNRARVVLARYVPLLGGAAAAAAGRSGRAGVQGLGGFLAQMGTSGLDGALQHAGLGALVGRDRFDIVDGLITALVGSGDDLDGASNAQGLWIGLGSAREGRTFPNDPLMVIE